MATTWRVRVAALGAVGVLGVTSAACAGNDKKAATPPKTGGATLRATEKEFAVAFDKTTVSAGKITLTVKNDGKIEHELVAFRTDLPVDQFPIKDGRADENGAGVTHFDPEAENIAAGASKTVTLDLPAGRYVFICNVPGHYASGMHAEVTVS